MKIQKGGITREILPKRLPEFLEKGFSLVVQASAYLDAVTFGRIPPDWEEESYAEHIRLACCAAADAYRCNEQGGGIASETNDGISVTYVSGISKAKTDEERLFDAVRLYLGSTGLLCRWV